MYETSTPLGAADLEVIGTPMVGNIGNFFGSGASAGNSPKSTSEALRVALVSDEKWLEMRHL